MFRVVIHTVNHAAVLPRSGQVECLHSLSISLSFSNSLFISQEEVLWLALSRSRHHLPRSRALISSAAAGWPAEHTTQHKTTQHKAKERDRQVAKREEMEWLWTADTWSTVREEGICGKEMGKQYRAQWLKMKKHTRARHNDTAHTIKL